MGIATGSIVQNDSPGGGGGGATIPSTSNLIIGDGAGNGADSGIPPSSLVVSGSQKQIRTIVFDGQGGVPLVGSDAYLLFPEACTITQWTVLAFDASGAPVSASAVIDIWKDSYANYPPTIADTITASAKPTLTAANKGQSATLTGWTVAIAANDILSFNLDSVSIATKIVLFLEVTR